MGQILAISGNSHDAQMTTIECYLEQTWPEYSHDLIDKLQLEVFGHDTITRAQGESSHSTMNVVEVALEEDTVRVTANGSAEFHCAIGQQLAWLGSVCRFPKTELCYCDTSWSRIEPTGKESVDGPVFRIEYEIIPFDRGDTQMCWHLLITDSTVATGFPIPNRSIEDKGLQVPTEIMAALAGVSITVDIGSGYFIKGETCALYPVHRNKDHDHIQWHLFDNGEKTLEYEDLKLGAPRIFPPEMLTLNEMNSTTAFVGWTREVINCAATENNKFIDYAQIRESEAKGAHDMAFNISGGSISIAKIVSGSINWTMSKRKVRPSARKVESYTDLLRDLSSRSIIFYDTEAKRSWLIDGEQASLQIMLHRSNVRQDYIQSDVTIAAAEPEQGVTAHSAMQTNEQLQLRKDWEAEKGEEMTVWFSKEVKVIWETMRELTALARAEYGRALDLSGRILGRQRIIGFDYMALITSKAEVEQRLKTVQLEDDCGEWPEIAKDPASLVLLARNFQEVLRPPQRMYMCPNFRELPSGRSYLAAELSTIRKLLKNSTLSWIVSEHAFIPCKEMTGEICSCNLVQQLVKAGKTDEEVSEDMWNCGAAIFGVKIHKLQKEQKTGKPLHHERPAIPALVHSSAKAFIPKPGPSSIRGNRASAKNLGKTSGHLSKTHEQTPRPEKSQRYSPAHREASRHWASVMSKQNCESKDDQTTAEPFT